MKVSYFTLAHRRDAQRQLFFPALMCLLLIIAAASDNVRAQDNQDASQTAPPPMKVVPRDERGQLAAARDAKTRTRIGIELADSHLRRAEELSGTHRYDEAASELGSYQGVIEDALRYLDESGKDNGKTRDLYRKIEIALRTYTPRIELIRRATPYEYAVNIKEIARFTRDARGQALDAFYGDTVLRENQTQRSQTPLREPVQEQPIEKKEP